MDRRGFMRLLGMTTAGLALATTSDVEEVARRFWPGYRAGQASRDATQVIAGRDVLVYTAPWNDLIVDSPWGGYRRVGWGQPWTDSGVTRDGLHFTMRLAPMDVRVDQPIDPLLRMPVAPRHPHGRRRARTA